MEKTLRIGVVGGGFTGVQHIEAARRVPGVEVVALADAKPETARSCAERLAVPAAYGDYREMLERERLDVVHNCTPNHLHALVCREAIARGLPVYCEKPLANTAAEAGELARLAQTAGVPAGVNFNYRQNAMVQEMRARVADTRWGRTFLVHGQYVQDWMMYDTDYNWRCVPEIGGASRTVADIGSHWFDTTQHILGSEIVRVYARLLTVLPQRKRFEADTQTFSRQAGDDYQLVDIHSEDAAFVMVEYANGVNGLLLLSQVSAGHKNDLRVELDGERYSLSWQQERADQLVVGERETGSTRFFAAPDTLSPAAAPYTTLPGGHAAGWHDALRNGIAAFYRAVRGDGAANYATFAQGWQIARLVEACLESSRAETWITVKGETP